jgi:hypothetical protein
MVFQPTGVTCRDGCCAYMRDYRFEWETGRSRQQYASRPMLEHLSLVCSCSDAASWPRPSRRQELEPVFLPVSAWERIELY